MPNIQLSKEIINQVKNDQDKLIIVNEAGEPQIVLMSYQAYQKLLKKPADRSVAQAMQSKQLTSDEILDKINQEIAQWKSQENLNPIALEKDLLIQKNNADNTVSILEQDRFYLETIDD